MKKILLITILTFLTLSANSKIDSFSTAKRYMKKVYKNHQITFYAKCKYNYKDKNNMINRNSCGYKPKNEYTKSGKINKRARRIEWEHVIPAENFGRGFKCWSLGDEQCIKKNNKSYKGRRCCSKVNQKFKLMQADMHNLVPAIGELNAHRSNFKYMQIPGEKRYYGKNIDFEVDFKRRWVEPADDIKGDIARTYFYFEKTYGMKISKQQKRLLTIWDKNDPVDNWEREKNNLIYKYQGNKNPFIR